MKFINRKSPYPQKMSDLAASSSASQQDFLNIMEEAEKSGNIDEAEKFMLRGLLACCVKDSSIESVRDNFDRAMRCSPQDNAILRNYARALFHNKLYAQAIDTLQKVECPDEEDMKIIGLSCKALGLKGKARQLLDDDGRNVCDLSCPACGEDAIRRVLASFDEDRNIWQSLSTR